MHADTGGLDRRLEGPLFQHVVNLTKSRAGSRA
jgi:hypothetical protein